MKLSAGLLLYRAKADNYEVLLVHPGGPYWARKDQGVWSIPKGEFGIGEEPIVAAKREFSEETGHPAPTGSYMSLGFAKQPGGKIVHAWAVKADLDPAVLTSNKLTIEWPPKTGKRLEIPEVDRADWFTLEIAIEKLVKGQIPLLAELAAQLGAHLPLPGSISLDESPKPVQTPLF